MRNHSHGKRISHGIENETSLQQPREARGKERSSEQDAMCILNTHLSPFVCKKSGIRSCSTTKIVSRPLGRPELAPTDRHPSPQSIIAIDGGVKNLLTSGLFRMTYFGKISSRSALHASRNHKKAAGAQPSRRAPRSDQLPSPHPTCPILSDKPRRKNMRHFPAAVAPTSIVIAFRSGGMSVSVPRAKRPTCSKSWL